MILKLSPAYNFYVPVPACECVRVRVRVRVCAWNGGGGVVVTLWQQNRIPKNIWKPGTEFINTNHKYSKM